MIRLLSLSLINILYALVSPRIIFGEIHALTWAQRLLTLHTKPWKLILKALLSSELGGIYSAVTMNGMSADSIGKAEERKVIGGWTKKTKFKPTFIKAFVVVE